MRICGWEVVCSCPGWNSRHSGDHVAAHLLVSTAWAFYPHQPLFQAWFQFSIGPSLTLRLSRRNATTDASSWRKRCERCVFCILDKSQCFFSGLWKRILSNVSCYGEREVFRVLISNELSLFDILPAIPLCSLSRCGRRRAKMEQHPLQKDWGTFFLASYTIIVDCRSRLTSVYLLLP